MSGVAWSEQATATDYATFAPLVLRRASEGDPIGRRIVERAADEIGDLLDMFLRQESTSCRWSAGCPEQLRLG
jgi:glucosamine kinase